MTKEQEYAPSPHNWVSDTVSKFEASGGTEANTMQGKPIIVLTSVGAKSGKVRKTPLMRVTDGTRYAVVASLGGAPQHPLWYHNIVAEPRVELQDGDVKRTYLAHETEGAERDEWWARAVEAWPDYAEYQKKTSRQIPVFVLDPAD